MANEMNNETTTTSEISPLGFQGSMQQFLRKEIGRYVSADFLVGTQTIVNKEGILFDVGVSFIVIYEVRDNRYVVCDFYSLKFLTFYTVSDIPVPLVGLPAEVQAILQDS